MKKTLISAVLSATLMTTSLAVVAKPNGNAGFPGIEVLKELDLSREQRSDIRDIVKTSGPRKGERKARFNARRTDLLNLLQNGPLSDDALEQKVQTRVENMLSKHSEMAQMRHQIWQVLDESQQAQLSEMDTVERKRRGKMPKPDLTALNLTEAQQLALEELKAKRETLHAEGKALRESFRSEELALVRQSTFDQAQWQALAQSYKPQMIEHGIAMGALHSAFFNTLDEEQQVAFVNQVLDKQQSRWAKMKERTKRRSDRQH